MKRAGRIAGLSFTVLLAVSAFASDKSTLNLRLDQKAVVNGTTLPAGDYKVELQRNGDQVQATFISKGKAVTSQNAHFENRTALPNGVSVVSDATNNSIKEIDSKKLKGGIVFGGASSESSPSGSN
jgi:hypothetical protein